MDSLCLKIGRHKEISGSLIIQKISILRNVHTQRNYMQRILACVKEILFRYAGICGQSLKGIFIYTVVL